MACSKSSKKMKDFFENVPDLVIDKIVENLPIRMAAQTSVLSKQWRRAWLSLKRLLFGVGLWSDVSHDWSKYSRTISNILLHHKGSVHEFYLYIPLDASSDCMNHSQWISFLSNNGVRLLAITNFYTRMDITSYIFWCSELVCLHLEGFRIYPPSTDFCGFPNLKHLALYDMEFINQNIFSSLIENCRMLRTLELVGWSGMDHIVIDAPSLQTLVLNGNFESLVFRNLRSLKSLSVCLKTMPKNQATIVTTIDAINLLSSSCQLQSITFDGHFFKFAAGGIERSLSLIFNHLYELCLSDLSLSEFGVLRDFLSMIERCPYIQKLVISVTSGKNVGQHIDDFNYNYKLDHLHEASIKGITGSCAELKLVEYLLAISPVLKNMFFYSGKLGIESEPKMLRALMGFPRASPKARLLFLEK